MKKKKRRKTAARKTTGSHRSLILVLSILCIVITFAAGFVAVRAMGQARLKGSAQSSTPVFEDVLMASPVTEEEKEDIGWQEGWIRTEDGIYAYNEDILTFLIMGIDKEGEVKEVAEGTNGGQADGLFLLVIDPHKQSIRILAINRNAMADVDVYDEQGAYVTTVRAQICTQHGFGNGLKESCLYQKKAVERFLYRLPIHGYAAINMTSVATINDAVDGVDVVVLEDMTKWDRSLVKDAQVHLMGNTAYVYATRRDISVPGSADGRLARQKQYLSAFMGKAVARVKENPLSALELYRALTDEMITDIGADKVAYLAPMAAKYTFDKDILTLTGETVRGEDGFEEFYADQEALQRLLLEVFYEPVGADHAG